MEIDRWLSLMRRLGFTDNRDAYDLLLAAYNEPHRSYHDETHIDAVLSTLDSVNQLASDFDAVELALWFHDAVYKIVSKTNEIDSAIWAQSFVQKNIDDHERSLSVHSLVMATQHNSSSNHPNGPTSDQQLIVDVDLAILGASDSEYAEFELAVRREYKLIPWALYRRKRIAVLDGFLSRGRVYSTDYFNDLLEASARYNLNNAIEKLKGSGSG